MPSNPLATFRHLVYEASEADALRMSRFCSRSLLATLRRLRTAPAVWPNPGRRYAGAGGPQPDKQCPENYRRLI